MEVNSSKIIKVKATGNPEVSNYSWSKQGTSGYKDINRFSKKQQMFYDGETLHMNNIQKGHEGTYQINAENPLGKTQAIFKVNVLYPPR